MCMCVIHLAISCSMLFDTSTGCLAGFGGLVQVNSKVVETERCYLVCMCPACDGLVLIKRGLFLFNSLDEL